MFGKTRGKLGVVEQALDFELRGIEERRQAAEHERVEQARFRDVAGGGEPPA